MGFAVKIDEFRAVIAGLDSGSVEALTSLYESLRAKEGIARVWIQCIGDPDLEVASTWMLKHGLETGRPLAAEDQNLLFRQLNTTQSWQAQLHLLQLLERLTVPEEVHESVARFCNGCIQSENKFVRAWGYSGMVTLAKQWPCYVPEAIDAIYLGEREDAGSVRARIRRVRQAIPIEWGID